MQWLLLFYWKHLPAVSGSVVDESNETFVVPIKRAKYMKPYITQAKGALVSLIFHSCKMTFSTHWTTTLKVRISSSLSCSPSLSFPLSCVHKNPLFSRRWKGQKPPLKNTTGWASEWKREHVRRGEQDGASKCVQVVCVCVCASDYVWSSMSMRCLTLWGGRDGREEERE